MDDYKKNGSGYYDPTAYHAIKHIEKDRKKLAFKLLRTIYKVAHLAGFIVTEIHITDLETGERFYDEYTKE